MGKCLFGVAAGWFHLWISGKSKKKEKGVALDT